ncbi:MAG TPA: acyl-CoA dehydrogenase family protein, partial [Candidatus Limnocylindrales bacterium]|nr:acyl-CoA dehydrogenase family protein [Candidatus Limnocylindrales bacterium]
MGRVFASSEFFNCNAPDTGNMEVLAKYGTPEQQERWLGPLLDGKIRSAYAMTEPGVASSDATNIETTILPDGDDYVVNGRKWWISGAMDPRCELLIVLGRTLSDGPKHQRHSMILVPRDTPGVEIVRPLSVFGTVHSPGGHAELTFTDVRVPRANLVLGEGRGFEIAQGRLGPGRIHHCMRTIGLAERALELMISRALSRTAFGQRLADMGVTRHHVAQSRMEIEQARLLTLKAAYMMDTVGNKAARSEIAQIKVIAPNMALRVVDRAMQIHGGMGVSQDTFLARAYSGLRTLRFADGPDEVHIDQIGRLEIARHDTQRRR